jgi:DNA primase
VVNLYDSDAAGQAASLRNMDLFLKEAGVAIAGVRLGEGKDPDEFLRARPETGVAELRALLHQAPALLDTWVDETIQAAPRTVQGRADCVNKISERLAFLTDPVGIQARVMDVAERLVLAPSIVMEAVQAQKKQSNQAAIKVKAPPKATQKPAHLSPMQKTEKFARQNDKTWGRFEARFLRYLLLYPERLRELRRMHQADAEVVLPRIENPVVAKVIAHLLQPINTSGEETESRRLSGLIEALDLRQETELKNFVAKALAENSGVLPPPASLAEVLRKVNFERSERGAESLRAQIKLAEASGDSPRVEVLQRELISLIQNSKKIQLEDANG